MTMSIVPDPDEVTQLRAACALLGDHAAVVIAQHRNMAATLLALAGRLRALGVGAPAPALPPARDQGPGPESIPLARARGLPRTAGVRGGLWVPPELRARHGPLRVPDGLADRRDPRAGVVRRRPPCPDAAAACGVREEQAGEAPPAPRGAPGPHRAPGRGARSGLSVRVPRRRGWPAR